MGDEGSIASGMTKMIKMMIMLRPTFEARCWGYLSIGIMSTKLDSVRPSVHPLTPVHLHFVITFKSAKITFIFFVHSFAMICVCVAL